SALPAPRAAPCALELVRELLELALGLLDRDALALLQLAEELVAAARDLVEIVVGELAPALLQAALELLPVALDAVPVHRASSSGSSKVGPLEGEQGPCRSRADRKGACTRALELRHGIAARFAESTGEGATD